MKKVLAIPAVAAVASFASAPSTGALDASTITSATSQLVTFGGLIVAGIGGIITVSAGLRLLVKGINRAVGK